MGIVELEYMQFYARQLDHTGLDKLLNLISYFLITTFDVHLCLQEQFLF